MTKRVKTIAVVSGGRADYDLLYRVMIAIRDDAELALQLIVSGAHLTGLQGDTLQAIADDGLEVSARVSCAPASDARVDTAKAMGHATAGFADAFERFNPELVLILGDRYEIFAAAQAANLMRLPIAHIHGGEVTSGAFDDAIRHAITKLSHYHFTSAEAYRMRVVQMGEHPDRVWNVGALGVDNIRREALLTCDELGQGLGFKIKAPLFVVTYHPVTMAEDNGFDGVREMIAALEWQQDAHFIITGVNADPAYESITLLLDDFVRRMGARALFVPTLGRVKYLSLLECADVVIGNSSSGIIETPSLGTPTVNIGPRQDGRLRAPSVIDCAPDETAIMAAITLALSPDMIEVAAARQTPCAMTNTTENIVRHIKSLNTKNLIKDFYDLEFLA